MERAGTGSGGRRRAWSLAVVGLCLCVTAGLGPSGRPVPGGPVLHPAIAPALLYGTYLGDGYGEAIAVDQAGALYIAESATRSAPTARTLQHAYSVGRGHMLVAKISPSHGLVYATYLGGRGDDSPVGIAVDSAGNAYVAGTTDSPDFPTTAGSLQRTPHGGSCWENGSQVPCRDAFVAKLNPSGTALVYSTLLGGRADDMAAGIAVDSAGNAYVTGLTTSADFPTTPGALQRAYHGPTATDAFVAELNAEGTALVFSTYLGGKDDDDGRGIALDAAENIYVTGDTSSPDFPTTPGALQPRRTSTSCCTSSAFVVKFAPAGRRLIYSTYLGAPGATEDDRGTGIAADSQGNAYVAGDADGSGFPTTAHVPQRAAGGGPDAFVAELNAQGNGLVYSTYLGGSDADYANGITVDGAGNAYVTGETSSRDFPVVNAVQRTYGGGGNDAFLAKLGHGTGHPPGTSLVYSTYLGGADFDRASAVAVDGRGTAAITGWSASTNFPTTADALQPGSSGMQPGSSGNVAVIVAVVGIPAAPRQTPASPGAPACCGALYVRHTGHNLSGAFLAFYRRYGGLDTFGYPRTERFRERGILVQYTDRFRLEQVGGRVAPAALGRQLTAGRAFPHPAPFPSTPAWLYFASTGHSLAGRFLDYWRTHHGAVVLGAPLSEILYEVNNDGSGRRYQMQWFEHGRLEYHPELKGTRYAVELGLLGKQILQQRGWLR